MVLYPILLCQSWSTTLPNFMLVSGIAQSGPNLVLSRLAKRLFHLNILLIFVHWNFEHRYDKNNTQGCASVKDCIRPGWVYTYVWIRFVTGALQFLNSSIFPCRFFRLRSMACLFTFYAATVRFLCHVSTSEK